MLKRIKDLFKPGSKKTAEDTAGPSENPDIRFGVDFPEKDIITFENLIEEACERYYQERENGNAPEETDPEITEIENKLDPMMRMIYLGSRKQNLQSVLKNIANILSEKVGQDGHPVQPEGSVQRAWDLFSYVMFRSNLMNLMRPEEVLLSTLTMSSHSDIPKDKLFAIVAESLAFIYVANEEIGMAGLGSIRGNRYVRQVNKENIGIEDKYLRDRDYGLDPKKPIFVKGFGPHRNYLDSLRTADGRELSYERRGSMGVDGIEGRVDIYDLFTSDKKKYLTIYQCVYGTHNSTTAPRGLKLG